MAKARRETGIRWILDCHHFREVEGPHAAPDPVLQSEILSRALSHGLDAVFLAPHQNHLLRILAAFRTRQPRTG
jgi:hypothetical protein